MKSYSETGIDMWIASNITLPERGFYVDLGCGDPEQYSNTAWLRDRGWPGLAIDGSHQYAPRWARVPNVKFINAVIGEGVVPWLNEPTNTLVSRVHPQGVPTPSINFGDMLKTLAPEKIEFLAMDIEDSEPIALAQMFAAGVFPTVMVIEYHSAHGGRNPRTIEIPFKHGYSLKCITNSDVVFVKE